MTYLGTYSDIFAALEAYPNGADKDSFVIISDKIHVWDKRRGMWVTDKIDLPDPDKPGITLFVDLTDAGVLTDWLGRKWQLTRIDDSDDDDDDDDTPTEPSYYYGWGITPAALNNMTGDQVVAAAKGSGNATKTLTTDNVISNTSGQCVWLAYPSTKSLTAVIKESGLEVTPTWLTNIADKTVGTTTYKIVFAVYATSAATIESLTYSNNS